MIKNIVHVQSIHFLYSFFSVGINKQNNVSLIMNKKSYIKTMVDNKLMTFMQHFLCYGEASLQMSAFDFDALEENLFFSTNLK